MSRERNNVKTGLLHGENSPARRLYNRFGSGPCGRILKQKAVHKRSRLQDHSLFPVLPGGKRATYKYPAIIDNTAAF